MAISARRPVQDLGGNGPHGMSTRTGLERGEKWRTLAASTPGGIMAYDVETPEYLAWKQGRTVQATTEREALERRVREAEAALEEAIEALESWDRASTEE